jgi:hypothetical protein
MNLWAEGRAKFARFVSNGDARAMTREEAVNKNLDLSFEFDRYLFEHPRFAHRIPDNALVILLPKYDRELREYNILVAKRNQEPGQPIVMVEIDALRPQRSRLVRPRMKVATAMPVRRPRARSHRVQL